MIYLTKEQHEEWVEEAIELSKVIIQDADLTGDFKDMEKEAMRNLLEKVRELDRHLNSDLPEACNCEDEECPAWQLGYDNGVREVT